MLAVVVRVGRVVGHRLGRRVSLVLKATGGADSHADTQVAPAFDSDGRVLMVESFPNDETGYQDLLTRIPGCGDVAGVGVESVSARHKT